MHRWPEGALRGRREHAPGAAGTAGSPMPSRTAAGRLASAFELHSRLNDLVDEVVEVSYQGVLRVSLRESVRRVLDSTPGANLLNPRRQIGETNRAPSTQQGKQAR